MCTGTLAMYYELDFGHIWLWQFCDPCKIRRWKAHWALLGFIFVPGCWGKLYSQVYICWYFKKLLEVFKVIHKVHRKQRYDESFLRNCVCSIICFDIFRIGKYFLNDLHLFLVLMKSFYILLTYFESLDKQIQIAVSHSARISGIFHRAFSIQHLHSFL